MHEFQAEVPDSRIQPLIHVQARLLGLCSEDRITASDVGHDWMWPSILIAQRHRVLFARPSAIPIAGAFRQEPAKDAMLGVKDGQMLVSNGFDLSNAQCKF